MKSLLNITVLISSVLSIFSASLTLYEVPVLKESISAIENGEGVQESGSKAAIKRIYISHDASSKEGEKNTSLLVAKEKQSIAESMGGYINVFGVRVANKNIQSST